MYRAALAAADPFLNGWVDWPPADSGAGLYRGETGAAKDWLLVTGQG